MSSIQHDPHILYSINNIRAFHIQNGEESELTSSGPQTLSLLMVPTSSPYQDTSADGADAGESSPEEDFYLHLHLPPELDMALPATTQIYHQPPSSYLIPRWDLGPDAGAFIRLDFPGIGSGSGKVSQEDVDTFETILAQCTAFLERATPPKNHATYNPADYAPGEGYISSGKGGSEKNSGQIVLVDEEDGSVVGELSEGYQVEEKPGVKPGSKNPVEIQLPEEGEGNKISITNVSEEYLRMARHPAFQKSTIVQTSATASRLIVTGSSYLANALASGADNFTQRTKPNPKPVVFTPAAQARIRKVHNLSQSAAGLSSRTAGQIGRVAQNLGATLARRKETAKSSSQGFDKDGNPVDFKAGVLNKSLIAFSTLMDGIEQGARTVLTSGGAAATTMIGHKYGADAGVVASDLTGGFKNVGLVYIDAAGVSRKAVLKSVARGMIVGRMHNGQQVVVGGGDGGQVPDESGKTQYSYYGSAAQGPSSARPPRRPSPSRTPPPAYGAPGTYSLGGTPAAGKQ
ncbi:senescence-associated protein-domain-containing protein [Talaromyces proteolyticus]|uniref:Senescence-associated protein-domain-containing protein n=1 Tax=Talaromyces proteolyticus TaxID=1131652 RepID=A0AAD4PX20_9EURO|nr:senescence-associated protein-domain-containing protein [Talaromyces proteolyticus]KAH8698847.1 senescence-associated protein-domain-containing protein [Talaromyces proteolyticus]